MEEWTPLQTWKNWCLQQHAGLDIRLLVEQNNPSENRKWSIGTSATSKWQSSRISSQSYPIFCDGKWYSWNRRRSAVVDVRRWLQLWRSGSNLEHKSSILQAHFNEFQEWCDKWGFEISTSKTTTIIFSNKPHAEQNAKIRDEDMKFSSTVKFLGVIFDKRLTWRAHIQYVVNPCNKRMNLLRAVSGNDWGADKRTLLTLYRTLIRLVVDYGSIAYDSASKTNKKLLNQIQTKALRICCGAMMMTPIV